MNKQGIIAVFLGGGIGSILRVILTSFDNKTVIWQTMLVNIIGSFIIGAISGIEHKIKEEIKLLLAVGFCGGFTTFSTFASHNFSLIRSGEIVTMLIYTITSILLGIILAHYGYSITNRISK